MIKSDATLEELELLVGNLKTHWIQMEIYKVFIITVIVVIALCGAIYSIYLRNCKQKKKKIYVYPETKNKYLAKGIVKMKDTLSSKWIDAVLYISFKNGEYYVRDKRQFLDKFVTLEDWEESNNGNVKSR